jgi:WD40 repeat protein
MVEGKLKRRYNVETHRPSDARIFEWEVVMPEKINYSTSNVLNTPAALKRMQEYPRPNDPTKPFNEPNRGVCAYGFLTAHEVILAGYEDGLICAFDSRNFGGDAHHDRFMFPLIGHTNRINAIVDGPTTDQIITLSNDCTLRLWTFKKTENGIDGECDLVMKFADPMSTCCYMEDRGLLFVAGWDRMVRAIDLNTCKIIKSWPASQEAIHTLAMYDNKIFAAGVDSIIRSWDMESGEMQMYDGHRSWVMTLAFKAKQPEEGSIGEETMHFMYSAGDDKNIFVWDLDTGKVVEQLIGHENTVTAMDFSGSDLITTGLDSMVLGWDLQEMYDRVEEKLEMWKQHLASLTFERHFEASKKKKGKKKKP